MLKIRFLGVEGYPQNGRKTISILLETENHKMLLDCGASIIDQLSACGLQASDIDTAFISHIHADHSSGLILLIYSCLMERFEKRATGPHHIDILGNQALLAPLMDYCKAAYPAVFNNIGLVSVTPVDISDNKDYSVSSDITVHTSPMQHAVSGLSIAVQVDGKKICYTADTKINDRLIEIAQDSDVLICNILGCDEDIAQSTGFMSATGAGRLATKVNAKKLCLLHSYNQEARNVALVSAKEFFEGDVLVPNNNDGISI